MTLRMLFFLDYEEQGGAKFANSPGLLPFIGHVRASGFDVDFCSTRADLLSALADPRVDVCGISSMQRMLPRSIAVAREVRLARPDVVLMIGGCALQPFAVDLAAGLFDLVVLGEAEHVLPAVLAALARARGPDAGREIRPAGRTVRGTVQQVAAAAPGGALDQASVEQLLLATIARDLPKLGRVEFSIGNVYVRDPARGAVWLMAPPQSGDFTAADCTALPLPARYLDPAPLAQELDSLYTLPWDIYAREGWKRFELFAQRGCRWGRCHFCSLGAQPSSGAPRGADLRRPSPARLAAIVAEAIAHGVDSVSFADDLFVQDQGWTRDLLNWLRALPGAVAYQAQTLPNRSVWPLLADMRAAGLVELAFGLETLSPVRAERLGKTLNGPAYVEQAMETISRTAAAGIYPLLYMIMVDPASTLVQVVGELYDVLCHLARVYDDTGILPKSSYSLMLLPIAGTRITARFPYETQSLQVGDRRIEVPTQFEFTPALRRYLARIGDGTAHLPYRRENLAAFDCYLESIAAVAAEYDDPHRCQIQAHAARGLQVLHDLEQRLGADVERTAAELCDRAARGALGPLLPGDRFDYRRFGGHIAGIRRFGELLQSGLAAGQS